MYVNISFMYTVVIEFNLIISKCYQNSLCKLIQDIYRVNIIIYTSTSSGVSKFYYSNSIIYYISCYIAMCVLGDIDNLTSSERERTKIKSL